MSSSAAAGRITRLLVANRGEIARRVMATCRAMGIGTVAVHSDPDADAPFVREADEAVALGGTTPAESYLRIDAIVDAARRSGADAVHPGYGFLSENAAFARAVIDAGLVFVGPPPEAIESMGSKLAARALMAAAGVPVLPGHDLAPPSGDGHVGAGEAAEAIGYPVLVKASAGGGGRGMRIVRAPADLAEAVAAARREAASAFGDDTVFLERYVDCPRHIEIQVFADAHGNVVHLFERECSIQRRHQKIIEEAPSPVLTPGERERMGAAAVLAARTIGYRGAGTVEFIHTPEREFFFLEMNTRLQVEHPVTEAVTGLDLVRLQILVAQGEPLPEAALRPALRGHAIEARLYAEDPEHDFLPAPGPVHRFSVPVAAGLRVDTGVEDGTVIGTSYDPMIAKVIAHAPSRGEAAQRLAWALRRAHVHGVVTNRDLLVGILEDAEFLAGAIDTHYLERRPPASFVDAAERRDESRLAAMAAGLVAGARERRRAPVLSSLPSGFRNNPSALQIRTYEARGETIAVGYRLGRRPVLEVDGSPVASVRALHVDADAAVLEVEGVRRRFAVHQVGDVAYVDTARASVALHEVPRFPRLDDEIGAGSLTAPMPGTVVRVEIAEGDRVVAGQLLAAIEAMKMEHPISAPADGVVVSVRIEPGQQVAQGEVLVVVEQLEDRADG